MGRIREQSGSEAFPWGLTSLAEKDGREQFFNGGYVSVSGCSSLSKAGYQSGVFRHRQKSVAVHGGVQSRDAIAGDIS